jgi:putative spermidine/putrescine transport system substrate-binding protein/spermidine/putrescine transport system substrate-binding protein
MMAMMRSWSGRLTQVALGFGAPLVLLLCSSLHAQAADELRVITFEGYAEPAWLEPFEAEFDAEVKSVYIGSNDEYMAKLAADAGRGDYDVVLIVSALVQPAIRSGFLEPLNLDLLPNLKDQFESMQTMDINFHDGEMYAACIFWGTSPLTVSSAAIPADADYGVLFDPKYAGKLAVWDDISSIADTATYMGYDNIWDLSDEELEAVKAKMIEQKPLLRKYWTRAGELIELFQTGEIVAANSWNYITNALNASDFPAHEVLNNPPVAWIDNYSIVKGTKNLELAHQYINHIISAKIQAMIGEHTGYTVCNQKSKEHMDPVVWDKLYMDEGPDLVKDAILWEEIPRREKYNEIWNEIKGAN